MNTLLVTPSRCIGCLNCELACASRDWSEHFPAPSKIGVAFFRDGGQVPITCFQCDSAPCLAVCKTGALTRNAQSGVVEMKPENCIGCRMCVMSCPFGNVSYSPSLRRAVKCDQCGGQPRCAAACPSRAIEFVPDEQTVRDRRQSFAEGLKNALKELV
ncbi:4Fe-4S ferredoxin [Deltaproteobacteria bacterium Smac51]|nr:4Fe-4S ferredoxin [Deltaproteobacteria bacterium Smac51]